MQSSEKNKPDQQVDQVFSSRIFSIVTTIKQSRATDGHGRDYIIKCDIERECVYYALLYA